MNPENRSQMGRMDICCSDNFTIDNITTQGRLSAATKARANEVLPEPEDPATPMILVLAHGGL